MTIEQFLMTFGAVYIGKIGYQVVDAAAREINRRWRRAQW